MNTNSNNTVTITNTDHLSDYINNQLLFNKMEETPLTLGLVCINNQVILTNYEEDDCTIVTDLQLMIKEASNDNISKYYKDVLDDYINNSVEITMTINSEEDVIKSFIKDFLITDYFNTEFYSVTYSCS